MNCQQLLQCVNREEHSVHIKNLRHLNEADLDQTVWRYLTFPKYISLLTYHAIWFSKLSILTDRFEGAIPEIADREMRERLLAWQIAKDNPDFAAQITTANQKNVEDGRELMLANCWFCDDIESKSMWEEYAGGSEALAVTSTIRRLQPFRLLHDCSGCFRLERSPGGPAA
jgi:hypothetical protein